VIEVARPSAATKHTGFEQEQTASAEAETTLCSLGYLLFKKCLHWARNLFVCVCGWGRAVLSAFTEKLPELCLVGLNASSRRFAGRGKLTLSKSPNRVGDFEHE
jgi:hypothetical protein